MIENLPLMTTLKKAGISFFGILIVCAVFSIDSQAAANNTTTDATISTPPPPPGVTMSYFKYKVRNSTSVILSWGTSSETMNQSFRVMKSRNSRDFTDLGIVPAHGTTTEPQAYQFTDVAARPGRNYYKLVQTNEDGRSTDVGTIVVIIDYDTIGVIIAPNPIYQYMSINTEQPLTTDIRIMNISGQIVKVVAPESASNINLGDLPKGMYVVLTEFGAKKIQVVN